MACTSRSPSSWHFRSSCGWGPAGSWPAPARLCRFFGDVSYPLYITHYPLIYIYTAWVSRNKVSLQAGLPVAALTFGVAVALAYACLKFYDEPVRRWLRKRFLTSRL